MLSKWDLWPRYSTNGKTKVLFGFIGDFLLIVFKGSVFYEVDLSVFVNVC